MKEYDYTKLQWDLQKLILSQFKIMKYVNRGDYSKDIMKKGVYNTDLGKRMIASGLEDDINEVLNDSDEYFTKVSDKTSDEYKKYKKASNDITNAKLKAKKISDGTYRTQKQANADIAKLKTEKSYKIVCDTIFILEFNNIKITAKNICDNCKLAIGTCEKYLKQYREANK